MRDGKSRFARTGPPHAGIGVLEDPLGKKDQTDGEPDEDCAAAQPRNRAEPHIRYPDQAAVCSPRRKLSIKCSEVRSEKARMLIVVVLSVQFKNTLASQT